ncbi:MAG: glyoxylase family protein [Solirubrobacteraceae bacterium]|jgi:glyoxylase I family protein|nr:glyoxylase family protein [Solirubrobacteraceae bacterium]
MVPWPAPARVASATVVESIHHIDLVVTSLERSLAFFRGLLGPLGYVREGEITGERGERVVYLNRVASGGSVGLRERQSHAHPVPYDRYAVGVHHIAFGASSRAMVDERAAWLLEQGATIESEPREYDYIPGYYAVFFHDPDGIKLEIVHRPDDPDTAALVRELAERVARLGGGGGA